MKKLFFIFLIFLTLKISAQTYYPFPKDSATWSVEEYFWGTFPQSNQCFAKHYGMYGDTIIEGKNYSKLYQNNFSGSPSNESSFNIYTATYVAAVREDSNKKIWVVKPADTIDILYYDFGLALGDTFCFDYFPGVGCDHPVDNIDSVLIDGKYRRQISFGATSEKWVEGIGSFTGWFEWQLFGNWSWQLLCYKEKQNMLYDIGYCNCNTYTGIETLLKDKIKIYPNPTENQITFEFKEFTTEEFKILIYSSLGKIIKTLNPTDHKTEINLSDLSEGIYFITITDRQGNQLIKKIIKTDS